MFEKLVSLLPYNPGLAHQLRFYGARMREEAGIRRIGLVFLVLTFFVQFFAVLSPPQLTSAADDTNDMIMPSGSGSALNPAHPRTDAYNACHDNVRGYGDALRTFGVSCESLLSANVMTVVSTFANSNGPLYSMGYHSYGGANPTTGRGTNEHTYTVNGSGRLIYARLLNSFGTTSYPTSLQVTASTGHTVYILGACGNLVTFGLPIKAPKPSPPPAPTPTPTPTPIPTPTPTPTPAPTPTPPAAPVCQYNQSLPASSPNCFPPCQYNNAIAATNTQCKPCDSSLSSEDALACVTVRKTASNSTQNIANADGTTAQPGDVIVYTLYAQNKGKAAVKQFTFNEDLSDVSDYADVTDLHGGTMTNQKSVSWQPENIGAGATFTHQITVKVKDPIPGNPVDPTDSMRFDLTMTNVYGNAINIKVPSPPLRTVAATTTALPNTGPGTSLFIAAAVVIMAGYFYSRARLLATESDLALKETTV
jgi:uncharacterized repeat protein (TIGR01451 family)